MSGHHLFTIWKKQRAVNLKVYDMALFKKPKKNIRTRNIEKDDDDVGNSENVLSSVDEKESSLLSVKISKKRDKEKDIQRSKQTTLLSFGDEEGENFFFLLPSFY